MLTFVFYPEIHATPESDVLKVLGPPRTWPEGDTILGPKSLMAPTRLIHWLYESLWGVVVAAEGEEDLWQLDVVKGASSPYVELKCLDHLKRAISHFRPNQHR